MARQWIAWGWTRIALPWLAGAALLLYGLETGSLCAASAGLAGAALLVAVAAGVLLADRRLAAAASQAVAALLPAAEEDERHHRERFGPEARALRPAISRLDRAWRDRLRDTAARLAAAEAIIAAAPDPLILIDRQRRIVGANDAAAEFVGAGVEPRDLAGALRNPVLLAATDAVLAGAAARRVEFSLPVPGERVLGAHLARLDEAARDGAAAILSLHDVTQLKRSEQMRADFVANAGHELKTPLAGLIGFIETLQGPARDDPAARARFLGIMHDEARRMARLVEGLLSLSRIELNEHVAPTDRILLPPVVEAVARSLELRAGERSIAIIRDLSPDLPEIVGAADELAQVFRNLLDNAVKYSRPHSEVRVTARVADKAGRIAVAVADQGDGIAPEHLPRLTERFYRADTARSRELGGTGLGLAIVKHILNRHRGHLEIASAPGRGSTFTVWLPTAPSVIPTAPSVIKASSNGHGSVSRGR